jgi:hypothetical protein
MWRLALSRRNAAEDENGHKIVDHNLSLILSKILLFLLHSVVSGVAIKLEKIACAEINVTLISQLDLTTHT